MCLYRTTMHFRCTLNKSLCIGLHILIGFRRLSPYFQFHVSSITDNISPASRNQLSYIDSRIRLPMSWNGL